LAAYALGYSLPPKLQVSLIDEKKPAAFSTASGDIVLSTGLFSTIDEEAQLAAIIGHEYSHRLLDHFSKLESSKSVNMAIEPGMEFEADHLSVKLLKIAGYQPIAALRSLHNLHRQIRGEVSFEMDKLMTDRETKLAEIIGE
jgi:predicted Zn-dependent protease